MQSEKLFAIPYVYQHPFVFWIVHIVWCAFDKITAFGEDTSNMPKERERERVVRMMYD
jgi:hypothetical protein